MKNWDVLKRFIHHKIRLTREEEENETYREIVEGTSLRGYSLWILGFAMVIACIGLNTDSTSAVIGAMLISPLMGPIIGFAFALAINDNFMKKRSIRNWILMSLSSLSASTLFFLISPFDNNTNALLSFQKATIFDILLAFFGGMAGFIGIIKKDGVKVIAGVAVATACMPPLCTAGYGIAHLDYHFFIGGLYFYLINCLFIGFSTFLLARFTGFHQYYKNKTEFSRTANWLWTFFMILMIVPSLYIAYQKWQDETTKITQLSQDEKIIRLEQKVYELDSIIQNMKKDTAKFR